MAVAFSIVVSTKHIPCLSIIPLPWEPLSCVTESNRKYGARNVQNVQKNLPTAFKLCESCSATPSAQLLCWPPLSLCAPLTLASFHLITLAKLPCASGPLHLLFFSRTFFSSFTHSTSPHSQHFFKSISLFSYKDTWFPWRHYLLNLSMFYRF